MSSQHLNANIKRVYWKVPFLHDRHDAFKQRLFQLNSRLPDDVRIVPVYQTFKSVAMFPNKDPVPAQLASGIVYKFTCEHCKQCYIGETVRHFCVRIKEHLTGKPERTEVTSHHHPSEAHHFEIVSRSRHTKIAEALHILDYKRHSILLNVQNKSLPLFLF